MDGAVLVEKLLLYAKNNLELNDYDLYVKRNLLYCLLNVKANEVPLVQGEVNYDDLYNQLKSYVTDNLTCQDQEGYSSFIFGLLMPLPSNINKKFRSMREKFGAEPACDYLYNLSVKSGQITHSNFIDKVNPLCNDDRAEVFIYKDNVQAKKYTKKDFYPFCQLCPESDGFLGNCDFVTGSLRKASLDLNGQEFQLMYVEGFNMQRECLVFPKKHQKLNSREEIVLTMLDFIEYIPKYSIHFSNDNDFSNPDNQHDYFVAGIFETPISSLKGDFSLKSQEYLDVEVSLFNKNLSVVRLQSFNRNTLESLAISILEKWETYVDKFLGISGKGIDGVLYNFASLSARYSKDNRYTLDIILTCNKVDPIGDNTATIFDNQLGYSCLFGRFNLNCQMAKVVEMMCAVLTKKVPLDSSLFVENGILYGYKNIVDDIIEEHGYFKDSQKAMPFISNGILNGLNNSLKRKSPFLEGDDNVIGFKSFLSTLI